MQSGLGQIVMVLLGGASSVAAGVLGGVLYTRSQPPPPRIVVMDLRALAQRVVQDPSLDDAARRQRTDQLGGLAARTVEAYAANGTIVLDSAAVLRAPKDAYVQP